MENEQVNASVFPGVIDTLKSAWEIYKQRFWVIVKLVLIPFAAFFVLAIIFSITSIVVLGNLSNLQNLMAGLSGAALIFGIVAFVIFLIAAILISIWSQIAMLVAIRDREERIGAKESLRRAWPKIRSYLWVSLLVGFVIMGGLLLAVVPGIIFLVWFGLAMYVFISEDIKGMDALLKSKEYVRDRWGSVFWRFFGFWLFVVGASVVLGFIPIVNLFSSLISSFVFMPLGVIYGFLVYGNVKTLKGEFEFVPQKRGLFIGLAIFGALIIPVMIFGTISLVALNSAREKARDIKRQNETNTTLYETDWQTYRNEEYGFEFKYPGEIITQTIGSSFVLKRKKTDEEIPSLIFSIDKNPDGLSLKEYYDGSPGYNLFGMTEGDKISYFKIDGQDAVKFNPFIAFAGGETIIIPLKLNFIYIDDSGSSFEIDQILSTFKFIK